MVLSIPIELAHWGPSYLPKELVHCGPKSTQRASSLWSYIPLELAHWGPIYIPIELAHCVSNISTELAHYGHKKSGQNLNKGIQTSFF